VDASAEALEVARQNLVDCRNVSFHHGDLTTMPLESGSCDFGYSLGVLHHVPDTEAAIGACVDRLRPGAPFLVYLYYDLEGAGIVRRSMLGVVTAVRSVTSRLPHPVKERVADAIAVGVYLPLARMAALVERLGVSPSRLPLFQYRKRSFSVMRNDALDRFGTRLEKRYSRDEVRRLMEGAGLERVTFSEGPPWWVAVGRRARSGDGQR